VPYDLARDRGPCDYDIRHNLTGNYVYQFPKVRNRLLGYALNGWQVSGSVFWHSGIPFSVLSAPYTARRKRHCQRKRSAVCECRARRTPL
jgi:hypothetical protein